MNVKNKNYWNNYYKLKENNINPSNFALFVSKKFVKKDSFILDVGSGDGRDSFYLRKKAKHVLGVDLSNVVIKKNKLKSKRLDFNNIKFKNLSSNHLYKIQNKKINFIYARFFVHAINEASENIAPEQDYKNENETFVNNVPPVAEGLIFKVQLGAYSKPQSDVSIFGDLPNVHYGQENGLYKYYSGSYTSEYEVRNIIKQAQASGFSGAFLVKFKDGKKL